MDKFFGRSAVLVAVWLFACTGAFAYEFTSPPYKALASMLEVGVVTPAYCEEVYRAYLALPRSCAEEECRHKLANDIYEMKILLSSWRLRNKNLLLNRIITGKVRGQTLVESLDALRLSRIQIHADEMRMLDGIVPGFADPYPVRRAFNLLGGAGGAG